MSFLRLWDRMQGQGEFELASYDISSDGPIANTETSGYDLIPMTQNDMSSVARDDVLDWMKKYGRNTTRIGDPMNDAEYRKMWGIKS